MDTEQTGAERDEAPKQQRPMPCDLPVSGKVKSQGEPLGPDGAHRRRMVARIAVIVAAVALIVLAVVLCTRACAVNVQGSVVSAAESGAGTVMAAAYKTAQDAHTSAEEGIGLTTGVVCIDAGHGGGYDLTLTPIGPGSYETQYVEPGGTTGVVTGVEEAQVTLSVALLLQQKLTEAGVTVVMVRTDDSACMSSEQRAEIANAAGSDLFVRLHCDGSDSPYPSGFSTLIPGYNEWTGGIVESSALAANIMHPIIIAETGANDAGIVERTDLAGFNFCQVPSVLFEMGFMSNPDEDVLLCDPSYQDTLAQAICDASIAYLEAVSS